MPQRRVNDPLGVSDNPTYVQDPVREAEIVEAFQQKLAHIQSSYLMALRHLGNDARYNQSLARLKAAIKRPSPTGERGERLHPELELLVPHNAFRIARERTGDEHAKVIGEDLRLSAIHVANALKARRGRPKAMILRHHAEALMALLQETSGKPVRASRSKNSDYDRHLLGQLGNLMLSFFQAVDDSVSEGQLADIVLDARRNYAGKSLDFLTFFPNYGGRIDDKGEIKLASGFRVEQVEWSVPIYCP